MPSIDDPRAGGRKTSPTIKVPKIAYGGRISTSGVTSAGKFDVSLADKPEEITSQAGMLAQAAVGIGSSLIQAVPVVGKGITDIIGGVAKGVSEIGFKDGPTVGKVLDVPVKTVETAANIGLEALAVPGKVVERGVAEARVRTIDKGTDAYADLPQSVRDAINSGDHSKAAEELQKQGKVYGDGFGALALSLILDPLNFIPATWITKPFSAAAKGVKAVKYATAGESAIARIAAERGQKVLRESVDVKLWDDLTQTVGAVPKVVNGKKVNLANQSIENLNSTLAGLEKSAAQNSFLTDSMLRAEEVAEGIISDIVLAVHPKLARKGDVVLDLKRAREVFEAAFPEGAERFDEIVDKARRGMTQDEVLEEIRVLQRSIQNQNVRREVKERTTAEILKARASHYVDDVDDGAAQIIRRNKLELDSLVDDAVAAEDQVRRWVNYSFGLADDEAAAVISKIMTTVRAGNREKALDALEWARQNAFGKIRREIGQYRAGATEPLAQRLTLASARSLTDDVVKQIDAAVTNASEDTVGQIIRGYVDQYDELFAKFGKTAADDIDRESFLKYLNDRAARVQVLGAGALANLPEDARKLADAAESIGYRLSLAPEDGLKEIVDSFDSISGREVTMRSVAPFADLVDDAFKPGVALRAGDGLRDTRSAYRRLVDMTLGERRSNVIRQRSYERFLIGAADVNVSRVDARRVWTEIHNEASRRSISPRGLAGLSSVGGQLEDIAKRALGGEKNYQRFASEMRRKGSKIDPTLRLMLDAYDGDLTQIGILPRLTAGFKTQIPQIMLVTDFFYPLVRFSAFNPFFRYVQENIEPKFFQYLRGIYGDTRDEILGQNYSRIIARSFAGRRSVIREYGDMQQAIMRASLVANAEVARHSTRFMTALDKFTRNPIVKNVADVGGRKQRAFEKIASREASEQFIDALRVNSPKTLDNLIEFYGTKDPYTIAYNLAVDYSIRNDPAAAARYVDNLLTKDRVAKIAGATAEEQALYYDAVDAFMYAFDRGSKVASRSIYYAQDIPFAVRSLNHPFLGVYPLSYMVTKIIPEFTRAMFTRVPFTQKQRIGVGYNAYREISEYVDAELQYGDNFLVDLLNDNPDFLYFVNMLFPAIPSQIGFSVPSWMRQSVVQPGLRGEGVQWERALGLIRDQATRGTVLGNAQSVFRAIEDVFGVATGDPKAERYNRFGQ